jgi:hypothetical protein
VPSSSNPGPGGGPEGGPDALHATTQPSPSLNVRVTWYTFTGPVLGSRLTSCPGPSHFASNKQVRNALLHDQLILLLIT